MSNDISKEFIQKYWQDYLRKVEEKDFAEEKVFEIIREIYKSDNAIALNQMLDFVRHTLTDEYSWRTGLAAVKWLRIIDKQKLLPELLRLAATLDTKRSVNRASEIILSFPSEWLKENFEKEIERLWGNDDSYYTGLLEISCKVDKAIARKYALKAVDSNDKWLKEIGEWMLNELKKSE